MTDIPLPPSLATNPNKQYHEMTLEELSAEHDYWDAKIREATQWGASLRVATSFRDICAKWIKRREAAHD